MAPSKEIIALVSVMCESVLVGAYAVLVVLLLLTLRYAHIWQDVLYSSRAQLIGKDESRGDHDHAEDLILSLNRHVHDIRDSFGVGDSAIRCGGDSYWEFSNTDCTVCPPGTCHYPWPYLSAYVEGILPTLIIVLVHFHMVPGNNLNKLPNGPKPPRGQWGGPPDSETIETIRFRPNNKMQLTTGTETTSAFGTDKSTLNNKSISQHQSMPNGDQAV
ncbi:hypothetical protein C0992_008662 [Termitomyces sp. T32_za158]|nr:hypothetical protein C0992_008662 [Termitomyces sp. T32_za158]